MRIIITGDRGFVGTETCKELESDEIYGYDLMDGKDIRDLEQLDRFVDEVKPDRILHLAAIARFGDADRDPALAFETNGLGTKNVAIVAGKYHIPVVYSSTGSVYMPISQTPPITEEFKACGNSVYGCSKYLGELYLRRYASPWIILRYGHLYGKEKRNEGLIGNFITRINRGLAPTLYGGNQSNDFVYVTDVARANGLALYASWDKWNEIYNVGTGEEITSEEAGKLICEMTDYKGEIEVIEKRTVDPDRFVFDCSKAKRLGFEAEFNFKNGLTDMLYE